MNQTRDLQKAKKWVSIYNEPYEQLSLISGAAFLIFCILDIALKKHWAKTEGNLLFLLGIVFFNGLHVMSTFVNCAIVPEYKTVFKKRFKLSHFLPLVILIGAIFFVNNLHLTENSTFYFMFAHFIILAPLWHALRQTQGLSLLYNQNYLMRSTAENRATQLVAQIRSARLEKTAVLFFVLAFYAAGMRHLSVPFRLHINGRFLFNLSAVCASVGLVTLLASIALFKNVEIIVPKLIFHTRTFARLLYPFTGLTGFIGQAVHGSEYIIMQLHIERNLARNIVVTIWTVAIPLFALKFSLDAPDLAMRELGIEDQSVWIKNLIPLGVTFTYIHYYMDSVLFKMSDPLCSQQIGALLLKRRSAG